MNERLLQFIWQFQYFNTASLLSENEELIEIVKVGDANSNQGPDFLNAAVKIDNTTLVGNIEIHIKSSQWLLHKHSTDTNYNNVILHIVWENDKQIFDANGKQIPTIVLQNRVPKILLERYSMLMESSPTLPCSSFLPALSSLGWLSWKERLATERLLEKSKIVLETLKKNNNNWEETFWQLLAYNFGLKINADFFKQIAETISVILLAKHKNNILQLEALLMGQANLLAGDLDSEYANELQKEYLFLQHKYSLKKVEGRANFLRMRPANFPTIRLAELASLVANSSHLFSKIKDIKSVKDLHKLFVSKCSSYWNNHYTLTDKVSDFEDKKIGKTMIENIIINTVAPILFAYGDYYREDEFKERVINWLQQLRKEDNRITKQWQLCSVENISAFDSQALIHLTNNYCKKKNCLNCAVGNKILVGLKKKVT